MHVIFERVWRKADEKPTAKRPAPIIVRMNSSGKNPIGSKLEGPMKTRATDKVTYEKKMTWRDLLSKHELKQFPKVRPVPHTAK